MNIHSAVQKCGVRLLFWGICRIFASFNFNSSEACICSSISTWISSMDSLIAFTSSLFDPFTSSLFDPKLIDHKQNSCNSFIVYCCLSFINSSISSANFFFISWRQSTLLLSTSILATLRWVDLNLLRLDENIQRSFFMTFFPETDFSLVRRHHHHYFWTKRGPIWWEPCWTH